MNSSLAMILQMSAITLFHIGLTFVLWKSLKNREITPVLRVGIGVIYGLTAVLSTHFGVDYVDMVLFLH